MVYIHGKSATTHLGKCYKLPPIWTIVCGVVWSVGCAVCWFVWELFITGCLDCGMYVDSWYAVVLLSTV